MGGVQTASKENSVAHVYLWFLTGDVCWLEFNRVVGLFSAYLVILMYLFCHLLYLLFVQGSAS